jgi:cellulose synthase (UDP-forming)
MARKHAPGRDAVRLDSTPRLPEWQERVIRTVAVITLAYSTYWVLWRWTATLNFDALWFAIPLVLAETYMLLTTGLTVFTGWRLEHRTPRPAPQGLSVDVFITTYDEPLEVVRRTVIGAREIRYPHRTWVLDDGKRDELKAMAEELGVDYIRRPGNEHAKAGNLNHALSVTDGEFVLQLDADHVPLPHILDRLLGFFDDTEVAFVQSPQDFYNVDSFTHDVNEKAARIWEEQRIFFSLIQPGKDHWNAAFFCGSCGVLRRSAFEEIGGFSTETITEDMETSLILHGRGWKSVYYGESLAYGLAPASAGAFHIQRLRWGQGSMQVLRKFNPLTYPGLTLPQRLCYLSSTISYLDGLLKLVLYLAPIVFFLTGVLPIRVDNVAFLTRFVPFLLLHFVMFELVFRGTGYLFIAERYNMAKFFTYILALSGFFARRRLSFNVTPKGPGDVPFRTYAPQLALAVLTAVSVVWATLAYRLGWMNYEVPGWSSLAFWFNFAWAVYNFGFAGYVVHLSLHMKQQRHDERFREMVPVRLRLDGAGAGSGELIGLTENLNPAGLALRMLQPLEAHAVVRVDLRLTTGTVHPRGRVVHVRELATAHGPVFTHGIEFEELSLVDRDRIELHCLHHAVPMRRLRYRESFDPFSHMAAWFRNGRAGRRQKVRLPARIALPGAAPGEVDEDFALLEDVGPRGLRLVGERAAAPGTIIRYDVPGLGLSGEGEVIFSRTLETPLGVRFVLGVSSAASSVPGRRWWRGAVRTDAAGGTDRA